MPRDKSRAYIKGGLQMSMEEGIKITASVAKRKREGIMLPQKQRDF